MWCSILGFPRGGSGIPPIASVNDSRLGTVYRYHDVSDLTTLWTTSGRTVQVAANNDPVGAWDNQLGSGGNLVQATAGNRPLYKTSQDGTPGIKFDETNDFLENGIAMPNGYEVYIVAHWTRNSFPGPGSNFDPLCASGVSGTAFELRSYNGFSEVNSQRAQVVQGGSSNGALWLDGVLIPNSTNVSPANQTHIISSPVGAPASNTTTLLGRVASPGTDYSPDAVKVVLMYETTHADWQRALVHDFFRYGGYGI